VTTQETTDVLVAGNEQTAVEAAYAAGLDAVIRLHDDALARIAHLAETWDQPQAEVQQAEVQQAHVQVQAQQAEGQQAEVSEDDVPTGEVRVLRMAELPTVVQRAA
jgi:predicted nucleotide-binding protein